MYIPIVAISAGVAALGGVVAYFLVHHMRFRKGVREKPLSEGLSATHRNIGARLRALFSRHAVDDAFLAELEETLISADIGMDTSLRLLSVVSAASTPVEAKRLLRKEMITLFTDTPSLTLEELNKPRIILILGVNGVGKTTSIAKLAYRFQGKGQRVLLAAGDTFRAAAIEQLKVWGDRLRCDVVAQNIGSDSASVVFDAVSKAKAKGHDVVLVDTAGRLHTKYNLMEELKKISRVISKAHPGAPHEKWLVLDATVGQNGLNQAKQFHEALQLTGMIVTKLDGTARGGIVCSITELGVPVVAIGVGEGMHDLKHFDPLAFVDAILGHS